MAMNGTRRQRCNEICLERIAARLCQLQDASVALATAGTDPCCSRTPKPAVLSSEDDTEVRPFVENRRHLIGSSELVSCCGSKKTAATATTGASSVNHETKENKSVGAESCKPTGSCCTNTCQPVVLNEGGNPSNNCCSTFKDNDSCTADNSVNVCCEDESSDLQAVITLAANTRACVSARSAECCEMSKSEDIGIVSAIEDSRCSPVKAADYDRPIISKERCCGSTRVADNTTLANPIDECCNILVTCRAQADAEKADRRTGHRKQNTEKQERFICAKDCCSTDADDSSTRSSSWAPESDLNAVLDRYAAMLRRGQCLCRRAIAQLGLNCCVQPSTSIILGPTRSPGEQNSKSRTAGSSSEDIRRRCTSAPYAAPLVTNMPEVTSSVIQDLEKQVGREKVMLNISGMTCTGCSRKLTNVLQAIPRVSAVEVTFVSGKAEFDFDASGSLKLDAVLHRIERETGFKVSRVAAGWQVLDVMMSKEVAARLRADNLPGIISIIPGKNDRFRVTYDVSLLGGRSLLEKGVRLAPPSPSARTTEDQRHLRKTAINTILAAALTVPVLVLEWADNPVSPQVRDVTALILGTLVQLIAVPEFYIGAMKSLIFSRVAEMDMLVVISISAAYVYSVVAFGLERAGIPLAQKAFFETSTLLITLVLLGRLIAAWARMRAVAAVSMRSLQAESAQLVLPDGQTQAIDARLLQLGDTFVIAPHSRVVTDGKILSGIGEVDESMVTGESVPVTKHVGESVVAGTVNGSGTLTALLTRLPGDNSITDIARLVEDAVARKPKVQELADKIASWFIPVVLAVTLIVFLVWTGVAIGVCQLAAGDGVGLAMTYAIAVLAISCPCAIGLAVPMVLVIAGGVAARDGVIIKAADTLEIGKQLSDVVFDKTGTLTESKLLVKFSQQTGSSLFDSPTITSLALAMVENDRHPVAKGVAEFVHSTAPGTMKAEVEGIASIPGAGIEATYQGHIVRAGNARWLNIEHHHVIEPLMKKAMTLFCLVVDGELALVYGLKSSVRSNAFAMVDELHQRGLKCHIVSGDNQAAVEEVAQMLNIPFSQVVAQKTPAQKQQYVHDLQSDGKKVLFLGDGTNDAVAIAQADVGMQMGSASDVTSAVADVVLISSNLKGLLDFLDLSRRSLRRIAFNFGWSAVYNFFAILLTSGALVKFHVPPRYAGLGEIVSVLPVVVAAATLAIRSKV